MKTIFSTVVFATLILGRHIGAQTANSLGKSESVISRPIPRRSVVFLMKTIFIACVLAISILASKISAQTSATSSTGTQASRIAKPGVAAAASSQPILRKKITFSNGVQVEDVGNNLVITDSRGRHVFPKRAAGTDPFPVGFPRGCKHLKHWLDTNNPDSYKWRVGADLYSAKCGF